MSHDEMQWDRLGQRMTAGLAALSIPPEASLCDRLLTYLRLLERWNRVYNLTAIKGREQWLVLHLFDCLAAVEHMTGPRVIDIGTGAGLPGLLIAMLRPQWSVMMLDRSRRKVCFVEQAIAMLALDNAAVAHCRVEDYQGPDGFDLIVSRAFTQARPFLDKTSHLAHPDSRWMLMKGQRPDEEMRELADAWSSRLIELAVPELAAERHLLLIERRAADRPDAR